MVREVKMAPLRPLDDFLLNSARYQLPNFSDLEKWGNRVTNNFLYYQTNYFLMAVMIFLLVAVIHPVEMLSGATAMVLAFGLFYYLTNAKPGVDRFKKEHPLISVGLMLTTGYFFVYVIGGVLTFIFGTLLPIFVAFIHASLRTRNMKNKIVNKIEGLDVFQKTPMGLFLDTLVGVTDAVDVDFETQLARKAKGLLHDIGSKSKLN
ncbi:PRA1 family protein 3 [Frankliniella fusca]|uniref:PRA1 family protein n=1 Tax=Frankliniella fusca TaxID=407009 RepID=A0AAE1LIK9_9NEOP|nr:PRA1 family protein 3 [Frankliniella fusca]